MTWRRRRSHQQMKRKSWWIPSTSGFEHDGRADGQAALTTSMRSATCWARPRLTSTTQATPSETLLTASLCVMRSIEDQMAQDNKRLRRKNRSVREACERHPVRTAWPGLTVLRRRRTTRRIGRPNGDTLPGDYEERGDLTAGCTEDVSNHVTKALLERDEDVWKFKGHCYKLQVDAVRLQVLNR